ncbi:response regulator [Butyrivibrio fibrisolvens]|jgi:two-component SAPR family response regulator|uniref:Stage 0 sporulation protein A homolog n=1 Tax=Butyrivibrio fibrisolvens TaxID=831 RepID=A0A317FVH4_BUTFI|nr:response regulator [Butyrivibrio fibrisolvens]PWT25715.1 two-component system response regulator [Butyrivibrio fibrisolvens]PWT27252.1 two-component system response regulator [Butyrivibrio fibrisolvens]
MTVICVDDEALILQRTVTMLKKTKKFDNVEAFMEVKEALDYLDGASAQLALLDIDMPEMTGLELAEKMKDKCPEIKIIFLTGYSEYAVDAYAIHASGYLLKPIGYDKLVAEINYVLGQVQAETVSAPSKTSGTRVRIETFGYFNILVDDKPVVFKRNKAKELIACLVDRQGKFVSRKDLFYIVWEDDDYDRAKQKYLDTIIRSLRDTLEEYKISDIFEMEKGLMRVVPEKFDCDLYRFLNKDRKAIEGFRGEYMSSYSWASETEGFLSDSLNM